MFYLFLQKLYKNQDMSGTIKSERVKRLEEVAKRLKANFLAQNKTAKVLIEEKNGDYFEGYSENYIKCFVQGDLKVGDVVDVKIEKPFKEGVLCSLA